MIDITNKKILLNEKARKELLDGVEIAANTVACTLGPRGRLVAIERIGESPHITKDGISIIKVLNVKDGFKNIGLQLLKEASLQMLNVAGDGTTTVAVLTHNLFKEGIKLLAAGHKPSDLKRGMEKAVKQIVKNLYKKSIKITKNDQIKHIGTVSSNGDEEIGKMFSEAIEKIGMDGVITIEEAKGYETTMEIVEGMQFNRGYLSPFFVSNSEKLICELNNPFVLITNKHFASMKEMVSVLEQIVALERQGTKRSILIICSEMDGEALNTLTVNRMRGNLDVCAIKAPEFGQSRHDMLEDIEILTNGKIVSDATGISISDIDLNKKDQYILGEAEKIIVGKDTTTIIGKKDRKEDVEKRIKHIKDTLDNEPTLSENDINILKRRLSRLAGGVAVIRVGGATEVEMHERKDRVDDALCATEAAIESGIVSGGGVALIQASKNILENIETTNDSEIAGIKMTINACESPLLQIASNAGANEQIVLGKVIEQGCGWDAITEEYCDLTEKGIIDPTKVPATALENASSIAGLLLTIEASIIEEDRDIVKKIIEGV